MKGHYISVDQDIYATYNVAKYMDTATVSKSKKFYKTTFPSDMIFTKADASTSDGQVENLTREFNIHFRACIGSLIYLSSKKVHLIFAVHKLAKFSSHTGKVSYEVLLHLLIYIRENKTFGLNYYADMKYALLSDLFKKDNVKTENQLMAFSDYSCKDCLNTGRSTGACVVFYQGGKIDLGTHVPGPVSQSNSESEYNAACTVGMDLAYFRMLVHECFNKDPYIFPEEAPIIILDRKSAVSMDNNGKDTKHTRNIARRVYFVRSTKTCKIHKIDWCEGGLQLVDIATKNGGKTI